MEEVLTIKLHWLVSSLKIGREFFIGKLCVNSSTEYNLFFTNIWLKTMVWESKRRSFLKPIVNNNRTYESFIEANKVWCNFSDYEKVIQTNISQVLYSWRTWGTWSKILDLKDILFKKVFLPRTQKHFEQLWKPFWVIINDSILKFHDKDRRKEIRDEVLWRD